MLCLFDGPDRGPLGDESQTKESRGKLVRQMLKEPVTRERMLRMIRRLCDLFERHNTGSMRAMPADYEPLIIPLALGHIRVRTEHVPPEACKAASQAPIRPHRGEGAAHLYLKHAGREWMRLNGGGDARFEARMYGGDGRADVYSARLAWVIECGATRTGKLVEAINSKEQPRFTLISFQHADDFERFGVRRLVAAHFTWVAE